ncbi:Linear gramicidin synthetase subunit D [Caballeronia novacaledonica]|uniref:Linear gramicidin synthetase subunit D n=1 Tax=Caballeronia novacaledonica TaxID=1544861 RepID=A0A2U3IDH9_9BURK|nr:Linear gramicidin synthetase subunit D [Caballeronia novacaledonica]
MLDYLGRLDHQVKIRGFRIELGEIEARFAQLDHVRETVVIAREGKLIAYVSGDASFDARQAKTQLASSLPDYMVPWRIVVLDALPLNANGKVDRKALPAPSAEVDDAEWQAPQSALETQLATIWSELLGVARIGRNDNFFELGGDSILGLQIVARARQAGWLLSARQVFEHQTVAQLAAVASAARHEDQAQPDDDSDEPFVLLPIQSWFFDRSMPSRHHWNQSVLLERATEPDLAHLEAALQALVAHHDSLRLRFTQTSAGTWLQRPAKAQAETMLSIENAVRRSDIERLCDAAQRSLDLSDGPLIRAIAMSIDDGTWRLLVVIHHLAVDGVSWRILLDDLQLACAQLATGTSIALPPHTTSYRAFARTVQTAARAPALAAQLDYWREVIAVPASLPCATNDANVPARATAILDRDATRVLLQDAHAAYRTQINDLLLTATARVLCRFAAVDTLRIDLEGHGREAHFGDADLSRTVGWFTSLYPVALRPEGDLPAAIKRMKETLRAVPDAGLGFGMLMYLGDDTQRAALGDATNSDVVFNYLGQFGGALNAESQWHRAKESTGASQDERAVPAHALEILGQVNDGELSMTLLHRQGDRYDAATLERLARDIEAELRALIAHCTSGARGITPSDVPLAALDQPALDALPLQAANFADIYPLAPMQTGIVFHSLLGAQSNAYVNQLRVDIDGLDRARFLAAWESVVARHDVLRTAFVQLDDAPRQWVARVASVPVVEEDWRGRDAHDAALDALAHAQLAQRFDIAQPPLMRIALVRTGERRHHFVWTFHHALLDGWSMAQVLAEVLRHYEGARADAKPRRYRDFIAWLHTRETERHEADHWWRTLLAPLEGPTHLAASLPRPSESADATFGELPLTLDAARTARLTDFAKHRRVTLNTLVQAAWLILLQRYTGARTVSFGATVAGRPASLEGVERMVGLFINTIPVVATPEPQMSVAHWLDAIQQQSLASREHEHVALYEIQRLARLEGGQALFDSILVFENYPLDDALRSSSHGGLAFSGIRAREQTSYPLTVSVTQRPGMPDAGLRIDFSFARDAFDEASVAGIARHLSNLLDALALDPSRALADIPMLGADEIAHVQRLGADGTPTLDATPVHERIAATARAHPDACALVAGSESISYGELERRANRLAHALLANGAGAESRVGIALARSIDMIVALFGVLKAGAAYVPLDSSYPADRLAYMARDSGVRIVLTSAAASLEGVVALDVARCAEAFSDADPGVAVSGAQLAYVIYTSGSTGSPKGVEISHAALARHTQAAMNLSRTRPGDRVLQFSTFSFDAFVDQLFPALCAGAAVVLRDDALWDSARFLREVRERRITIADLTTAYWNTLALDFANDASARDALTTLRRVQVGGEAMYGDGVRAWKAAGLGHIELVNLYGPSEATVTATSFDCAPCLHGDADVPARIPIGKPIDGRRVAVLDAHLAPVPVGVAGELHIGGELLARGYCGKPATTAERFIPDPFSTGGGRLYRTGDIVRWNARGELDYLGRVDHQVKVRGYRVEPGEIEAHLLRMPGVREAAVVARATAGTTRLAAFVTADASTTDLRARLAAELPGYMVPATLTVLDAMPLNPAGKIDRHRLPSDDEPDDERTFAPPEGEFERALAQTFGDVLRAPRVSRHDTFFALGGDSLAAMQVQSALRRQRIEAPLPVLMSNRPLHEVARALQDAQGADERIAADAASMLDLISEL